MTLEFAHTVIIVLLVAILVALGGLILVSMRVATLVTQTRELAGKTNGKNGYAKLETMEDSIEAMRREFLPTDGASFSYRLNALVAASIEDAKNAVYNRAAQTEAVNAVRGAQESISRVLTFLATLQEKLDAIAIIQARQGQEQAKIVNTITAPGRDQVHAGQDFNRTDIGAAAQVGQVAAGASSTQSTEKAPALPLTVTVAATVEQAQKGVDQAQKGVDETQKGIDKTQRSIDQAKAKEEPKE